MGESTVINALSLPDCLSKSHNLKLKESACTIHDNSSCLLKTRAIESTCSMKFVVNVTHIYYLRMKFLWIRTYIFNQSQFPCHANIDCFMRILKSTSILTHQLSVCYHKVIKFVSVVKNLKHRCQGTAIILTTRKSLFLYCKNNFTIFEETNSCVVSPCNSSNPLCHLPNPLVVFSFLSSFQDMSGLFFTGLPSLSLQDFRTF